jgi:hypothetical protein
LQLKNRLQFLVTGPLKLSVLLQAQISELENMCSKEMKNIQERTGTENLLFLCTSYFFMWAKHVNGDFVGFQGGLECFNPNIALRCVQDKKSWPPRKTLKIADVFCPHNKITSHTISISGALIVNNLLHSVFAILESTSKKYTSLSRRIGENSRMA